MGEDERTIAAPKVVETAVVEGELIVPGRASQAQRGVRRLLSRIALAVTMVIGGTVMVVAGLLLILTLLGAPLGVIVAILGIGVGSAGLMLLLGPRHSDFRLNIRKRK